MSIPHQGANFMPPPPLLQKYVQLCKGVMFCSVLGWFPIAREALASLVGGGTLAGGAGLWAPIHLDLRPYVHQWQLASGLWPLLGLEAYWS